MDQNSSMPTYSTSSSQGLFSGIPAVIAYGDLLYDNIPEIIAESVNVVLDKHVVDSQKSLRRQPEYNSVAKYYDVQQSSDRRTSFNFGFFHPANGRLTAKTQQRIHDLEYGDAENPPRAFVRRNLFKKVDSLGNEITKEIRSRLGESS